MGTNGLMYNFVVILSVYNVVVLLFMYNVVLLCTAVNSAEDELACVRCLLS